ncbi:MAG: hypothetical protein HYY67_06045 [Thaumarchaeota archaeon]|nr:hypothetical protein [Nitrososphaerota archaeon]
MNILEKDAKAERLDLHTFISTIIKKYIEWGRYTEIGFVNITFPTFQQIFEAVETEKLLKIGKDVGERIFRQSLLHFFKESNLNALLEYFDLYGRYAGLFDYEFRKHGETNIITLRHGLESKYSKFLVSVIEHAMIRIGGVHPESQIDENVVIIKFKTPEMTQS